MDEPFLTGANTSGETLEQMCAHQHIRIYRAYSLGGAGGGGGEEDEGWRDGRRAGTDPEIPEMGEAVYTLKALDAIRVNGEHRTCEIFGDLGP